MVWYGQMSLAAHLLQGYCGCEHPYFKGLCMGGLSLAHPLPIPCSSLAAGRRLDGVEIKNTIRVSARSRGCS